MGFDTKGYLIVKLCVGGVGFTKKVHRLVMAAFVGPSSLQVDHINMDKRDNRITNLEYVDNRENSTRAATARKTSSQYVGVYWVSEKQKWKSVIKYAGNQHHLIYSKDEKFCSNIYQDAVRAIRNGCFEDFMSSLIEFKQTL